MGELEPIAPERARVILEAGIRERLGDDWRDEDSAWVLVSESDYAARFTRGRVNLDFYVDLLGNLEVTTRPLNPAQQGGRLIAWMLLGLSIAIAFLIARIVGWV